MNIENALAAWDGKSSSDIHAIYTTYSEQPGFPDNVIMLAKDRALQSGATWLLKAWLESGKPLQKPRIMEVYCSLDCLHHWQAKLHILQSMPFMAIDAAVKSNVHSFLTATLTDPNKFVRAWSYNGLYELAKQHPEYHEETTQFFEMAMRDEAASVRARIRNIRKTGF